MLQALLSFTADLPQGGRRIPAYCRHCLFGPSKTLKIHQMGVQWKQGVVIYMLLYSSLLYNTTTIHCTPLRLHPPVMNTQTRLNESAIRRNASRAKRSHLRLMFSFKCDCCLKHSKCASRSVVNSGKSVPSRVYANCCSGDPFVMHYAGGRVLNTG